MHHFPFDLQFVIFDLLNDADKHMLRLTHVNFLHLPCQNIHSVAQACCQYNYINILSSCQILHDETLLYISAKYGHLNLIQYLHDHSIRSDHRLCDIAARHGHLHIIQWLIKHDYDLHETIVYKAASGGHMTCLKWLMNFTNCAHEIFLGLIKHGNISYLEWASDQYDEYEQIEYYEMAVKHDHLHVIQWMYHRYSHLNDIILCTAVHYGRLKIIKWILSQGCDSDLLCEIAAENEQHEILQWALDQGCMCNGNTYALSTYQEEFILQRLLMNGISFTSDDICAHFVHHDDVRKIKIMHEHGAILNETCCEYAAFCGRFACLKWLYDQGVAINANCIADACDNNNFEILQWLYDHHAPYDAKSLFNDIKYNKKNKKLVKWLYRHNYVWHNDFILSQMGRNGNLKLIKWIYARGGKINEKFIQTLLQFDHLHILKWALQKFTYSFSMQDVNTIIALCNIKCLVWVHERINISWQVSMIESSVRKNHLACLQYLISQGCPWPKNVFSLFNYRLQLRMFRWCMQMQCSSSDHEEYVDLLHQIS